MIEKTDRKRSSIQTGTGVIHGRFQVFHNDHLRYILEGRRLCGHLVIGITNPDPSLSRLEEVDSHRTSDLDNPLTYYERYRMIRAALVREGVPPSEFSVVPFPVSFPGLYRYYVPLDALFFLTIYDDWGKRKLEYFRSMGLRTHVIREVTAEQKGLSGRDIRHAMLEGEPWEHLVPPPVDELLLSWKIPERLRKIKGDKE